MTQEETLTPIGDPVAAALADFRIYSVGLVVAARSLPWAIVVIAVAALVYGADQMFMSGLVAAAIAAFLVSRLRFAVPEALTAYEAERLAARTSTVSLDHEFLAYLRDFDKDLNSWKGWALGAVFAIAAVPQFFISPSSANPLEVLRTSGVGGLASLLGEWRAIGLLLVAGVGYLLGLFAWRMSVVGYQIYRLGGRFDCRVQPQHPDQAGGFAATGRGLFPECADSHRAVDLLRRLAHAHGQRSGVQGFVWLPRDWFFVLLLVTFALAVVAFVAPLYGVHRGMMRERSRRQGKLDDIGNAMDDLRQKIRGAAEVGASADVAELEKQHAVLLEVYKKERDFPTWPVDTGLVRKYFVTQIVPLLSVTKVADEIAARLSGGLRHGTNLQLS